VHQTRHILKVKKVQLESLLSHPEWLVGSAAVDHSMYVLASGKSAMGVWFEPLKEVLLEASEGVCIHTLLEHRAGSRLCSRTGYGRVERLGP
jgi:hypothetical protein